MTSLFPQIDTPVQESNKGPFVAVAIEQGIDRLLDYMVPAGLVRSLRVGQRVKVPLGRNNRSVHGIVIEVKHSTTYPRLKSLLAIDDDRVLIDPKLMELALWMSRYYITPLGTVLESIVPSAVKRKTGVGTVRMVRALKSRAELQESFESTRAPKRRAILARLMLLELNEGIELPKLASESGCTPATVTKLVRAGLISITAEQDMPRFADAIGQATVPTEIDIQLNEGQQKVFTELLPRLGGGFSVNLLLGVTGSGKTEIYLQCIRKVIEQGKQALILVPEIALTPQTVRRFTARFPRVAVLHSGLSQTERHRFWHQISTGQADVVVGARSAIFAPLPQLGAIVVDEEHESSYKQDTAPRYHARDVAIKRGQLESIPVLLGSATPSLEMYYRSSQSDRNAPPASPDPRADSQAEPAASPEPIYHLLHLPRRVRNLALPHVEMIDLRQERTFRSGVHLLSRRLEKLLGETLAKGEQAILLLNRRGYSNFVYCASCQEAIHCKYCDTTMTYHRSAGADPGTARSAEGAHTGQLHCHYFLAVNPLPEFCPACKKKLILFGLGTQRVEEELKRKFPDLSFERVDSDTMRSSKDYEATLARFAGKTIQVLLGTQMIAKGLDFPNVTLVGVISGDTALALPDFRAAERTFQLITQVAGRAGRGDVPGRVVLQTLLPETPAIRFALKQDYAGFAAEELGLRKEVGLPPFARMVRIVIRDTDLDKLHARSEDLAASLSEAVLEQGDQVRLRGPMPCPISRISGYFRNQIVLISPSPARLQKVLASLRHEGALAKSDRIAVDVDPVSLL